MQMDMFHNTIGLLPSQKAEKEVKASNQNDMILKLFEQHRYCDFTPSEVYIRFGQQWPITSVRRAISDLTKMGLLIKTDRMRTGLFGEKNHCWKYAGN